MDLQKQKIQQQLTAKVLIDQCSQSDKIIFRDAWCTQDRVVRFTTPFFRTLFAVKESERGKWKTGDLVMYEVSNLVDSLVINCVFCCVDCREEKETEDKLLQACGISNCNVPSEVVLKRWNLSSSGNINRLFTAFTAFLDDEMPRFESELNDALEYPLFKEGTVQPVILSKYERNLKARAACLAAHGTACVVCGIDFGAVFGPEFSGIIEVHHIVPLSEIGEEYVVDPVNDLRPVCPNCHTAIHSKKDGVYTVEELYALRNRYIK